VELCRACPKQAIALRRLLRTIEAMIAKRDGEAVGVVLLFPSLSTRQVRLYLYVQNLGFRALKKTRERLWLKPACAHARVLCGACPPIVPSEPSNAATT